MARIAFLSTAHIHTKGFLENLSGATDGRTVHAIWDGDADRGRRYAKQFHAPFVDDLGTVLGDTAVDGFIVGAENARHLPLLRKVLPTGKPVFCEKPLTAGVADLRTVVRLVRKHRSRLMSGYFQPFSGAMQAVAGRIAAGDFGEVTRVRFRNSHSGAYGRWFDNPDLEWFHNPSLAGGGAFMDLGTHAIHLLRTLFGPVTDVWADIRNQTGIYPAVDDFGVAHLRFASGLFGTVEAAWTQNGGPGGLEIAGSKRSLWHTGKEYVVGASREGPIAVAPQADRPKTVDRLVAIIRGQIPDEELAADLRATVDAVAIMEAAYRSSATGRWARVASVPL